MDIIQVFRNDYNKTCHPAMMQALADTTAGHYAGYGMDIVTEKVTNILRELCACPAAEIHFIAGGTLTNLLSIASCLRPHEAVIAASSGHIEVHETGAVEATGHKVITVPSADGKLKPEQIKVVCAEHDNVHMVQPRLVYISQATELGTVYTKAELADISATCKELGLYLFVDGARIGAAITCQDNTPNLVEVASLCDAFYIGGTKNGALFGEALVLVHEYMQRDFRYLCKQRGAMLAKGWLISSQFEMLFKDNLFFELAKNANEVAKYIDAELKKLNVPLFIPTQTNQIFPIVSKQTAKLLAESYAFETWSRAEHEHTIRFVTSWASSIDDADKLISKLKEVL